MNIFILRVHLLLHLLHHVLQNQTWTINWRKTIKGKGENKIQKVSVYFYNFIIHLNFTYIIVHFDITNNVSIIQYTEDIHSTCSIHAYIDNLVYQL